jgi:HEAT repeat protein
MHDIVANLATSSNAAAVQAMGHALLAETGVLSKLFAGKLLAKATPESLSYLVRVYHRLDNELRTGMLLLAGPLSGGLRQASRHNDPQSRRNAVKIITLLGHTSLAYILVSLLHDDESTIRTEAAQALRTMADRMRSMVLSAAGDVSEDDEHAESMLSAGVNVYDELMAFCAPLEVAMESFSSHLRTEVVESAMYLAPFLPARVWDRITATGSRVGATAVEILRRDSDVRYAGFAFRALCGGEHAREIARIVSVTMNHAFIVEWLRHGWYRFLPAGRKGLAWIKDFRWLSARVNLMDGLPERLQVTFLDILSSTTMPIEMRLAILEHALGAARHSIQEQAVRTLVRINLPATLPLLQHAATSNENEGFSPRATRMAAQHVAKLEGPTTTGISADGGSRPQTEAVVARLHAMQESRQSTAKMHFNEFWASCHRLTEDVCRTTVQHLQKQDTEFLNRLRERLTGADAADRLKALSVIRKADLVKYMSQPIQRLCGDPDAKVRASAVMLLPKTSGRDLQMRLIEAMDDPDPRVQANAIDALEELNVPFLPELVEKKLQSPSNRIRANAIRAILKPQYTLAMHTLVTMLDHPDPTFRRSALWAISEVTPLGVLGKVNTLAGQDPDPEVQQMAQRALGEITEFWKAYNKQRAVDALHAASGATNQ